MPPLWVPAAKALSVVAGLSGESAARLALCGRAHAGLVKTYARLFTQGDRSEEHTEIPSTFWWAGGHEALEQDWRSGDFSTWIENKVQWRALGVSFDFEGLREMLPAEDAAAYARRLSVGGNPDWVDAKTARRFMYSSLGANPTNAGDELISRCRMGFVAARAVIMQRASGPSPDRWSEEAREWDIPVWYWENFTDAGSSAQNWQTGKFSGRGASGRSWFTLTGVYFDRASLDAMLPQVAPSTPLSTATINAGRPPAAYWDDLWCAIWGQIYRGELIPKRQADVERAMLQWANLNDHEMSETSAKPRAKKLFAEFEREVGNSLL